MIVVLLLDHSAHPDFLQADDVDFKSENPIPTLLEGRPVSVLKTHTGQSEEWQNYGLVQGDGAIGLVKRIQVRTHVFNPVTDRIQCISLYRHQTEFFTLSMGRSLPNRRKPEHSRHSNFSFLYYYTATLN